MDKITVITFGNMEETGLTLTNVQRRVLDIRFFLIWVVSVLYHLHCKNMFSYAINTFAEVEVVDPPWEVVLVCVCVCVQLQTTLSKRRCFDAPRVSYTLVTAP